jgi:predicted protein tyrosine phosphatase
MIKGTMNQIHNVSNPYQTETKKVLAICSAGLLRSPTVANVLHKEYGYNTRACGISDYALIPLSEALILWADEVVVVHYDVVKYYMTAEVSEAIGNKLTVLNIPDSYEWNQEDLVKEIKNQYAQWILENKDKA